MHSQSIPKSSEFSNKIIFILIDSPCFHSVFFVIREVFLFLYVSEGRNSSKKFSKVFLSKMSLNQRFCDVFSVLLTLN